LKERNESETNRLIDLLKKNPSDALKYAIPISDTSRGISDEKSALQLRTIWNNFSLFGNHTHSRGSGGSISIENESLLRLQNQYSETAIRFIKNKEFEKAAFVYLKLLKDYVSAAKVLEDAKMYSEAASIYLKYCKNEQKAAQCYEKGKMTLQAIELYEKNGDYEKVGDLYMFLQKKDLAFSFYQKVINYYIQNRQYVKASLLARHKMNDNTAAQVHLLTGWRNNNDAFNCINNYFANIKDPFLLEKAIKEVYDIEVTTDNKAIFLQALEYEFKRNEAVQSLIRNIAYETPMLNF
jgi:tetratricopeptide (TPR) repeat protein